MTTIDDDADAAAAVTAMTIDTQLTVVWQLAYTNAL